MKRFFIPSGAQVKNNDRVGAKPNGFTLIELLVVSTIIVVLSAIGLVSFVNAGKGARDAKRKSDLETVRQALVLYRSDNGTYPAPSGTDAAKYVSAISILSTGNYLSNPTPVDPKNDATYFYAYNSTGTSFNLYAVLERDQSTYTLTNP